MNERAFIKYLLQGKHSTECLEYEQRNKIVLVLGHILLGETARRGGFSRKSHGKFPWTLGYSGETDVNASF